MLVNITTERFLLRSITRDDDLEPLRQWVANPKVMTALNLPARELSEGEARAYVGAFDAQTRFLIGVFPRPRPAQLIGFYIVEVNLHHRTATWHMAIGDRSFPSPDVTLEASPALLEWLFGSVGIEKMIGTCTPHNRVILQRYRSTGWRQEGVLKEELRSMTGPGRLDQVRFGLLKAEWPAVRSRFAEILRRRRRSRQD
jgi:RimJ/RimL family protein N-acetyltransferase